jgi:hypothetical protein
MFYMRKWLLISFFLIIIGFAGLQSANAQCSICTKTAMQQGEKPAQGLNSGIIYLMLTPFAIAGYIGYRWWQGEKGDTL